MDIAHPMFWTDGSGGGSHPAPFTLIKSEDIQNGTWLPVEEEHKVSQKMHFVGLGKLIRTPHIHSLGTAFAVGARGYVADTLCSKDSRPVCFMCT